MPTERIIITSRIGLGDRARCGIGSFNRMKQPTRRSLNYRHSIISYAKHPPDAEPGQFICMGFSQVQRPTSWCKNIVLSSRQYFWYRHTFSCLRQPPLNGTRKKKNYAIIFVMNTFYDTFPIQIENHSGSPENSTSKCLLESTENIYKPLNTAQTRWQLSMLLLLLLLHGVPRRPRLPPLVNSKPTVRRGPARPGGVNGSLGRSSLAWRRSPKDRRCPGWPRAS